MIATLGLFVKPDDLEDVYISSNMRAEAQKAIRLCSEAALFRYNTVRGKSSQVWIFPLSLVASV